MHCMAPAPTPANLVEDIRIELITYCLHSIPAAREAVKLGNKIGWQTWDNSMLTAQKSNLAHSPLTVERLTPCRLAVSIEFSFSVQGHIETHYSLSLWPT